MVDQNWIRIRRHLAEKIESLVNQKLGGKSLALQKYEKDYFATLEKKWKSESRNNLLESLLKVRLIYLGDFHALRQSQKAHLRILRSVLDQKEIVIAMECFTSDDQKHLNLFLQNKISEDVLLKKTAWKQRWGFPWENYKLIVQFAKDHRIPIYGLNVPAKSKDRENLQKRDLHAAREISQIRKQNPRASIFVIYGDLHLADAHMPAKANKLLKEPCVRVFQNYEKLYYRLAKENLEGKEDLMRSGNDFCILNTAPWVKWQNYLMYLEQNFDISDSFEDDEASEYTDHVARWVHLLAVELGFKISTSDLAIYSLHDEKLFGILEKNYTKARLDEILEKIKRGESFYLADLQIGILAELSVNHSAHLAAEYVHAQKQKELHKKADSGAYKESDREYQFLKTIWIQALAYFGTKLVNPNRKSNTLMDLQKELLDPHPEFSREALVIALSQKFYEQSLRHGNKIKKRKIRARHKSSWQIAARLLGAMLGEKIYNGYRLKKVKKSRVRAWYTSSLDIKHLNRVYYKEVTFIDSLPTFFESKLERL